MKYLLFLLSFLLLIGGCQSQKLNLQPITKYPESEETIEVKQPNQNDEQISITLSVDGKDYEAYLYQNEATLALIELMPITLTMDDLNGNEKFGYLETYLPTNEKTPGYVEEGQLMLFGRNCLVLFYEGFSTSYSYTQLGLIDDQEALSLIAQAKSVDIKLTRKEG